MPGYVQGGVQGPGSLGAASPILAPGAGGQVVGSMPPSGAAPPNGMPMPPRGPMPGGGGALGAAQPITAPAGPNAALVNALRGSVGAPNTPDASTPQIQPRVGIPAQPQPAPMMQPQPVQARPIMESPMIGRNMQ